MRCAPFWPGTNALAQLELAVVGVGAAEGPVQVDAVGDDGHGEEAVAQAPDAVVVLGHAAHGVAAGVGGVVPGAVVVHGPVHELEVGVGADVVDVEEIGQGHLAQAELDAAGGNLGGEREEIRILGDGLIGKADDLVNLVTGGIRIDAEIGVADHVEVGLAGQPQRLAQAASQGGFEIEDQVGVVADGMSGAPGGVEGADLGSLVLGGVAEAVGALVGGVERQAALEDDVGLAGEPPLGVFAMGEQGEHGVGGFDHGLARRLG